MHVHTQISPNCSWVRVSNGQMDHCHKAHSRDRSGQGPEGPLCRALSKWENRESPKGQLCPLTVYAGFLWLPLKGVFLPHAGLDEFLREWAKCMFVLCQNPPARYQSHHLGSSDTNQTPCGHICPHLSCFSSWFYRLRIMKAAFISKDRQACW